MPRSPRTRHPIAALALCFALTAHAGAAPATPSTLPELPSPPSLELGKPEPAHLAELDELLKRITGADAMARDQAIRELLEAEPKLVPALAFRVNALADSADKEAMKRLLGNVRKRAREAAKDEEAEATKDQKREQPGPDYLTLVAAEADPESSAFRELISLLAMSRMLEHIGTVEAVRALIGIYVRFGEFMRVDTQRALARLGDKAIAALIEAKRHPAEKIAKWAHRQLDALGKAIPSEAVQTNNHQVLADVLRAYGRTRDPDAIRIVVSFANNDRSQVREASRQAIALMGEVCTWQLRDTYESIVGKKPPRDWTWERTARELFGEFDRLRSAEAGKLFEAGNAALASGDLETMRASFDKLLARDPEFERRAELSQGYLQYGKRFASEKPETALAALRRAERLGSGSPLENEAKSLRLTLEAERLAERHVADRVLLRRALELDANNARAKEILSRIDRGETKQSTNNRYLAASAIGAVALLAIAFILLRKRDTAPVPAQPETKKDVERPARTESPEDPAQPVAAEPLQNDEPPAQAESSENTERPAPAENAEPVTAEPTRNDEPPAQAESSDDAERTAPPSTEEPANTKPSETAEPTQSEQSEAEKTEGDGSVS